MYTKRELVNFGISCILLGIWCLLIGTWITPTYIAGIQAHDPHALVMVCALSFIWAATAILLLLVPTIVFMLWKISGDSLSERKIPPHFWVPIADLTFVFTGIIHITAKIARDWSQGHGIHAALWVDPWYIVDPYTDIISLASIWFFLFITSCWWWKKRLERHT
jgi:hypothetical protein